MAQSDRARLAVDIGGTFTDVVLEIPGGRRVTTKLLTTYAHPGEAVLKGIAEVLRQSGTRPRQVVLIIHGTTLATNALIERSGAVTADHHQPVAELHTGGRRRHDHHHQPRADRRAGHLAL